MGKYLHHYSDFDDLRINYINDGPVTIDLGSDWLDWVMRGGIRPGSETSYLEELTRIAVRPGREL